MINDDNSRVALEELNPMKVKMLSEKGSFVCRRAIGESYFDEKRNRTYVSWNEEGLAIYLAYYDHETKAWSKAECVFDCQLYGRWEYHDYVTMVPDQNGNPILFYHIHSKMAYIIKKDANGAWSRRVLSEDQNDYPAPIRYQDKIYYFYSQNKEISYPYRPLRFMKSADDGETWSSPRDVIDSGKMTPDRYEEVYQTDVIFAPAGNGFPDRFLLSFTMWGGKRHAAAGKGAYCVAFYPSDDLCYDLDGNCLGEVIDYKKMKEYCEVDPGRISEQEEFSHVTYGPLASVDEKNRAVIVYGHRDETQKSLIMKIRNNGKWEKSIIAENMWNVEDVVRVGNGIEAAVVSGGSVVIFRKEDGEANFKMKSITTIPHKNNSNSVPYLNFLSENKDKATLLLSLFDKNDIEGYCHGNWPVVILSEV